MKIWWFLVAVWMFAVFFCLAGILDALMRDQICTWNATTDQLVCRR